MADANQWWDFYKTLPQELPDTAYDAIREQFFYREVAPEMASRGVSPSASVDSWMKATTRPGKSSFPKLEVAGAAALKGVLAPIVGISGKKDVKDDLAKFVEDKKAEALRQGSHPLVVAGSEMVGELGGTAPYFALGVSGSNSLVANQAARLGVGRAASQAAAKAMELGPKEAVKAGQLAWDAALKNAQSFAAVPAIGAVQGLYDAAKADEGHRLVEGLQGAAIGTAGGAMFEGLLRPRAVLRALGLDEQEAVAVSNVMKGFGTDQQHAIAANVVSNKPEAVQTLAQWLTDQVRLAKKTATPREPIEIESGSKFSIVMRASDGQEYTLFKQDPAKIDRLVEVVDKHLQKGGEIIKINGDASVVNKLMLQFENFAKARGEFELPVTIKGGSPDAGPLVLWKPDPSGGAPTPNVKPVDKLKQFERPISDTEKQLITEIQNLLDQPNLPPARRKALETRLGELIKKAPEGVEPPAVAPPQGQGTSSPGAPPLGEDELGNTVKHLRILRDKGFSDADLEMNYGHRKSFQDALRIINQTDTTPAVTKKPTSAEKIELKDLDPLSFLEQLPDGTVLDKKTGAHYGSMETAFLANKIKFDANKEWGGWYTPSGQMLPVKNQGDHAKVASGHLRTKSIIPDDDWDAYDKMFDAGAVRVATHTLQFKANALNKPSFEKALMDVYDGVKKFNWKNVQLEIIADADGPNIYGSFTIPKEHLGELLMDTKGYLKGVMNDRKRGKLRFDLPDASRRDFLKTTGGSVAAPLVSKAKEIASVPGADAAFKEVIRQITGREVVKRLGDDAVLLGRKLPPGVNSIADLPDVVKHLYSRVHYRRLDDLVTYPIDMNDNGNFVINALMDPRTPKEAIAHVLEEFNTSASLEDAQYLGKNVLDFWKEHDPKAYDLVRQRSKGLVDVLDQMKDLTPQELELLTEKGYYTLSSFKKSGKGIKATLDEVKKEVRQSATDKSVGKNTGKELIRTPVALGEEGKGGIMQRFEVGEKFKSPAGDPFEGTIWKETPTQFRGVHPGQLESLPTARGVTQPMGPGVKPFVAYFPENIAEEGGLRRTVFHESLHGNIAYLGIEDQVNAVIPIVPGAKPLLNAFSSEVRRVAGDFLNEELVTHLTSAIRTNHGSMLDRFVAADGSMEEVLQTGANIASTVKSLAMQAEDSLHQRQLIRRMDDVIRRAGSIQDLRREVSIYGDELTVGKEGFTLTNAGRRSTFKTREELVNHIEQNYREPLNAPNLLDETGLPPTLKYSLREPIQSPPLSTDPTGIGLPPGGRLKGGVQTLSFFFRPFYSWLETVSKKNNWPELYGVFKDIDLKLNSHEKFVAAHEQKLYEVFKDYSPGRRSDLYHYMETPASNKSNLAQQLNLTPKEIADANKLRTEFFDPLFREFNIDSSLYLEEYAPRLRAANYDPAAVSPSSRLTRANIDFFAKHIRTGELDPRDTDLLRVSHAYLRIGARQKFLGSELEQAAALVNSKTPEGDFVFGTLQPLFKRHLEHLQGRPDFTQRMVDGAVGSAIDLVNEVIVDVNRKLPTSMQLGKVETPPQDVLGRYVLFSYAGTLGLRPMTIIRDSMQLLMTTYPMLGEKYMLKGISKAFGVVKGKRESEAWKIADQYGALIHRSDLGNLYSGGYETLATSKVAKTSEWMLKWLEVSNNSNRLASFWGHAEKAMDAMRAFSNDPAKMARESGMHFLDKDLAQKFTAEFAQSSPAQWQDLSYRIAKEMVDISQWNYKRGANPGTYKYALGRLAGQYGTWPMNYIEYARRLASSGDKTAYARFFAMHYGVLKTGEALGIDTSSWVFTAPASYAGSPMFSAAISAPTAIGDTQSIRGQEARERISRLPQLAIPGGLAAEQWYKAVTSDDPNKIWIFLGFDPLDNAEMEQGVHNLP